MTLDDEGFFCRNDPSDCESVDGLVRRAVHLEVADLKKLHQQDLTHDFTCLEGWTVPGVKWSGVLVETVLFARGTKSRGSSCAGKRRRVPLRPDIAAQALLAIYLGNTAVPPDLGGPIRLVVPGGDCFMNIKCLDHLELRSESGPDTAREVL